MSQSVNWSAVARARTGTHSMWSAPVYERMSSELHRLGARDILDIGCGTGEGATVLASVDDRTVIGADVAVTMIEIAREQSPQREFHVASAEELPFETASFDAATSVNSVHFCSNVPRALREIHRILRPAGRFLIHSFGPRDACAHEVPFRAMLALVPVALRHEAEYVDPFRLSSPGVFDMLLADVGLEPEASIYIDVSVKLVDTEAYLSIFQHVALYPAVSRLVGADAVDDALVRVVEEFRTPAGGIELPCAARILVAKKS